MGDAEDFYEATGYWDVGEYIEAAEAREARYERFASSKYFNERKRLKTEEGFKTLGEWNDLRRTIKKNETTCYGDLFSISQTVPYKLFYISKKNGKFRRIFSLYKKEQSSLRELLPYLEEILIANDTHKVNYGFVRNRNCVEHAMQHIGYQYTISMDLESFFESVKKEHITKYFKKLTNKEHDTYYIYTKQSDIENDDGYFDTNIFHFYKSKCCYSNSKYPKYRYSNPKYYSPHILRSIEQCFIFDSPQQGLPTSPLIANLAFLDCDRLILEELELLEPKSMYTRYADDLVISCNNKDNIGKIIRLVSKIVENFGFKLNKRKTKIQNIKNGRVVITGVAIDKIGAHPTRKTLKKIRAAKHAKNESSLLGLEEWSKCRLPRKKR